MENKVFNIQSKTGEIYSFTIERGGIANDESGKLDKASCAFLDHADGTSSQFYWNEYEGHYQVASVAVSQALRNQGIGVSIYKALIDEALSKGKSFHSDCTVSSEALKIYPKLAKQGFDVHYAPDEEVAISQPAEEATPSRPKGSQQFIRDKQPVAWITGKHSNNKEIEPNYIKALTAEKPEFHLYIAGQNYGPYTKQQVVSYIEEGRVNSSDFAWKEGLADWTKIVDLNLNNKKPNFNIYPERLKNIEQQDLEINHNIAAII